MFYKEQNFQYKILWNQTYFNIAVYYYLKSNLTFLCETQKIFDRVYFLEISIVSKIVVSNLAAFWLKRCLNTNHMRYLIGPMDFILENMYYNKNDALTQ